jgi:predicted nucleic acid-binding protein
VKPFLDTSVLVAGFVEEHPHHSAAATLLNGIFGQGQRACTSGHALAETYAVLTRAPAPLLIYPNEVWQMLEESILPYTEIVTLSGEEYQAVIRHCAVNNWSGGRIYDLLHIHAARKAGCERLYTFNVKHFQELSPADFQHRVCAP